MALLTAVRSRNWRWFVRPHPSLDAADRRNATLLMMFLLGYMGTSTLGTIFSPYGNLAIAGVGIVAFLMYMLTRSGYFRLAFSIMFLAFVASIRFFFDTIPEGEVYDSLEVAVSIEWVLIPIFVANAILPLRMAVYLSAATLFYLLSFPLWFPQVTYPNLLPGLIFPTTATIMTLVLALHRNELEKLRLQELRETQRAQEIAEEANKTKSQFLANMSHELRTPLNAILNFTGFVADGVMGDVNDEQKEMLNQSISSSNHLLSLINDILDISKIESGLMDMFIQPVNMNEIIISVESVGNGLVKDKPVRLITEIDENLPTTHGDKRRLRQVLLNVVSNAVKFTSEGEIIIRARAVNNCIYMEVQDTGIGIAKEDQHLIFEPFKQAKHELSEIVGTGLGIPISKYFVESHKGKMYLESEVGVGTTFFIELPVLTEEEGNEMMVELPA